MTKTNMKINIKSFEFNPTTTEIICEGCGQANPECMVCKKMIQGDCYCGDIAKTSKKIELEHLCSNDANKILDNENEVE